MGGEDEDHRGGAGGDIGRAVCAELAGRHDLVTAGRSTGEIRVDMGDPADVARMYERAGRVDAVMSTAGDVQFGPLEAHTHETLMMGLRHEVMGQINLVLAGLGRVSEGGSFTLTSGVLDRDPIPMGTAAATANGALGGFVVGAAIEMPRGLRLNVVSPGLLDVSVPRYGAWFPGHEPVPAERVGRAYAESVEGALTGQVIVVG